MNCISHNEEMAVAVCRICGDPICQKCIDLYDDKVCNNCVKILVGKSRKGFFSKYAFMDFVKAKFNASLVAIILSAIYLISMWLPVISNKSVVIDKTQGQSFSILKFVSAEYSDNELVGLFNSNQIIVITVCVYLIVILSILSIFYAALMYHKRPQITNIFMDLTAIPALISAFIFIFNLAKKNKEGSYALATNGFTVYVFIVCSILVIIFAYLTYFVGKKRYKKALKIYENPSLMKAENREIKVFYTLKTKEKTVVGQDIEEGVYAVYSPDNVKECKIELNGNIERFYPNQQFSLVEGDVLEPILNNVQLNLVENKIIEILRENSVTYVGDVRGISSKTYDFRSEDNKSPFKFAVNGEVISADIPIQYSLKNGDVVIILKGNIKITPVE